MKNFADLLDHYLIKSKNQEERPITWFVEKANLPRSTFEGWLSGSNRPTRWTELIKLAFVFNLDKAQTDELLECAGFSEIIKDICCPDDVATAITSDKVRDRWEKFLNTNRDEFEIWLVQLHNLEPENTPTTIIPTATSEHSLSPICEIQPPEPQWVIGRDKLVGEIIRHISSGKHCLLQGMGGVGKTAIAKVVARRTHNENASHILWADVADTPDIGDILASFAESFNGNLKTESNLNLRAKKLRTILRNKEILLILENVTDASQIRTLLPYYGSQTVILATTQYQDLDIENFGELIERFEVKRLTDNEGKDLIEHILKRGAVLEQLTHESHPAVVELCQLCDGRPSILEHCAHNLVRRLEDGDSLDDYVEQIKQYGRLRTLDSKGKISQCFEPCYRSLYDLHKSVFRSLSIFSESKFSIDEVAAIHTIDGLTAQAALHDLKGRYFLTHTGGYSDHSSPNFSLGSLQAEFTKQKLAESGEYEWIYANLVQYYEELVLEYNNNFQEIGSKWPNIKRLLFENLEIITTEEQGSIYSNVKVISSLTDVHLGVYGFLDAQGEWSLAISLLQHVLDKDTLNNNVLLKAIYECKLGLFYFRLNNYQNAQNYVERALLVLANDMDTSDSVLYAAYAYDILAQMYVETDMGQALELASKGVSTLKNSNLKPKAEIGYLLVREATIRARLNQLGTAEQILEKVVAVMPDPLESPTVSYSRAKITLGKIRELNGDFDGARHHWNDGYDCAYKCADLRSQANLKQNLAILSDHEGSYQEAINLFQEALGMYRNLGDEASCCKMNSSIGLIHAIKLQNFPESVAHLREAKEIAEDYQVEQPALLVNVRTNMAWYKLEHSKNQDGVLLDEVVEEIVRLEEIVRKTGQSFALQELCLLQAEVLLATAALGKTELAKALDLACKGLKYDSGDQVITEWLEEIKNLLLGLLNPLVEQKIPVSKDASLAHANNFVSRRMQELKEALQQKLGSI